MGEKGSVHEFGNFILLITLGRGDFLNSWTAPFPWFARFSRLENPEVFQGTVDTSFVYAYGNQRQESEFLGDIPCDLKRISLNGGETEVNEITTG